MNAIEEFNEARDELTSAFKDFLLQPLPENAEALTKAMWKYGPAFGVAEKSSKILIDWDEGKIIEVDPNQDKYTCQPYGVPKCPRCLKPTDECGCGFEGGI
jgi:hypothetical protein